MLNNADKLKLKRQIADLDETIKEVEQQLAGLGQGGNEAGNNDNAAAGCEQADTSHLIKLNDILNNRFNLDELNSLAFSLGLDLYDLPGNWNDNQNSMIFANISQLFNVTWPPRPTMWK